MRDFLAELGIEQENFGASNGAFFQTSGTLLTSVSSWNSSSSGRSDAVSSKTATIGSIGESFIC